MRISTNYLLKKFGLRKVPGLGDCLLYGDGVVNGIKKRRFYLFSAYFVMEIKYSLLYSLLMSYKVGLPIDEVTNTSELFIYSDPRLSKPRIVSGTFDILLSKIDARNIRLIIIDTESIILADGIVASKYITLSHFMAQIEGNRYTRKCLGLPKITKV